MVGHDKGLKESIILINQCLYTQHELLKMVMLIWNVFISSPKEEKKYFFVIRIQVSKDYLGWVY